MEYVEKLEAEHVLAAMRILGWKEGEKPPTHVLIRLTCKEKFGNGGDGNRCGELREAAMVMAMRESGKVIVNNMVDSVSQPLPEEFQNQLDGLVGDFGKGICALDSFSRSYFQHYRNEVNGAADERAEASSRKAKEREASDEAEIKAAMLAIQSNEVTIDGLKATLTSALADTARAEGRASVLSDQVEGLKEKNKELEQKLDAAKDESVKQMKCETAKPSGTAKGQVKRSQKNSAAPCRTVINEGGIEAALQVAPHVEGGE